MRMASRSILGLGAMALALASCVASWRWDWNYRVERGSEAHFRDVTALCRVVAVDEVEGLDLEPVVRGELGFRDSCSAGDGRRLEVEFRYARETCETCGAGEPRATGRVIVVGPEGVEAESTWVCSRRGLRSDEYARSFASAVRGFVLWGNDIPERF